MDRSIKIGGEAGQGIQTLGDTLARVLARAGFHVFTHQDYDSRIRGGHNFYQIRFSEKEAAAPRATVDIVVALDPESISRHAQEFGRDGRLIYDASAFRQTYDNPSFLDVPFSALALEHGGSRIMANTAAVGAVLGMLGIGLDILTGIIGDTFARKGGEVIAANIRAASAGYDFAVKNCPGCSLAEAKTASGGDAKMLITGTEAIGFGALSSGCSFYSAYPMTPSTGIMNYLAEKAVDCGIIVEQAEDEIAAINMALGASFAGARSMTGTAGGGFALMVEGLSLAGMTETPIVIALGQRPAPATGLPTRTEQADLDFALHAGHGEFPRLIFAPGTPEQAFYLTNKAFDLAEKFQIPAIIMFDTFLADCACTYEKSALKKYGHTDYRLRGKELSGMETYRRHAFTDTGVSPLAAPGDSAHPVVTDSDEHDEDGHIAEDAATRVKMVNKRLLLKLPLIGKEIAPPFFYGHDEPEIVIAGWGSVYGVIKESVDRLMAGSKIAMLHFSELWPFPSPDSSAYLDILKKSRLSICVENNATGQFARLIRRETGFVFNARINRYDGRPFTLEELIRDLEAQTGELNA